MYTPPENLNKDEVEIWRILIYNDFHAFCKGDWSMIEGDFDKENFFGIQGNNSNHKLNWNLQYNTLDVYKKDWLNQSLQFRKLPINCDPLKVLFDSTKLSRMTFKGDFAFVHKEFDAEFSLKDNSKIIFDWISVFTLKRIKSHWKIISFVGYLPKN